MALPPELLLAVLLLHALKSAHSCRLPKLELRLVAGQEVHESRCLLVVARFLAGVGLDLQRCVWNGEDLHS